MSKIVVDTLQTVNGLHTVDVATIGSGGGGSGLTFPVSDQTTVVLRGDNTWAAQIDGPWSVLGPLTISDVESSRDLRWQTSGSNRWIMRCASAVAESGGNAGSDFQLLARDDAGSQLFSVLTARRSDGHLGVNLALSQLQTGQQNQFEVGGGIASRGTLAGLAFADRGAPTTVFTWYATGTIARLYTGSSDRFTVAGTGKFGYPTGLGGTVTQATSKSTAVTLNRAAGEITTHAASLADGASVTFTVNTTAAEATDVVCIMHAAGGTAGAYTITPNAATLGSFRVTVRNVSGGALAEALVLRFALIAGATA